jgi:hypothetical protein
LAQPQFTGSVHVEGIDALTRSFGRVNHGLRREMQKHLRVAGRIVANEAKAVAGEKGLRDSGQLIARVGISVRGGSVFVRDTATRSSPRYPNYSYPSRYEYERGGYRAFMRPALDRKREAVIQELDRVVDWVATEWGA